MKPLNLDARDSTAFAVAYEASLVPLEDVNKLQQFLGDTDISWATGPTM